MKTDKSHNILVVEDEGLIAHDIVARLESMGHTVIGTAETAALAIEKAANAELVLMDIRLDGRADGVDAAMVIRERYGIPVIFLTAHADRPTLERAKVADPFGYIVKPIANGSLVSSIEIAMHKHRLSRELEQREAQLRAIVGSVSDAVIVTGADGRVLMMNRAAEKLTGARQAQNAPLEKVVRLEDLDSDADITDPVALAILRDAPVAFSGNWKLTGAGGREMWVEGSAAPIALPARPGQTAPPGGAVLTFRDVSARRWEERQLRQANKLDALSRLAFGVSSDYANLLATIRTQTEQLMRQFGEYSAARKSLQEIYEAASSAEQMNARLNSFGTRLVGKQETLSMNSVLRRAHRLITSVAGAAIEVTLRPEPSAGRIRADAGQIEQALMSMVLHACASMAQGGRLLIETGAAEIPVNGRMEPHTLLAITYTGEESDPEKLFEPSAATEEALALSMVHAIAVEHNGFVSAQRTAAGGCRFEFLLPRASVFAAGEIAAAPTESVTILLATETEPVLAELHNFFEAHGFNLLEAASTSEALALAQVHEGSIHLLIADRAQAPAIVKELGPHGNLQVLEIVDGREENRAQIARPLTEQTLLARVRELLGAKQALAEAR